jgi:putative ATP-dependent endonuclease of OLD family
MIKRLTIRNYRSIKSADINLGAMSAFIGSNNAGKSNLMKALNLVLGDAYPSPRAFDDDDFHDYDKKHAIQIEVLFDNPLVADTRVFGFRLMFNGSECDYVAINSAGNTVTYSGGREVRVSNDMREEVALMYLGLERQANQQIRATTWTLYGKLLRHIEKHISESKKIDFRKGIEGTYSSYIEPEMHGMEEILRKHIKQQTGLDLQLRLSVVDPIETIKNLRPYLQALGSREFDAENMGAGTQSALAIAIARAYAEIVRRPLILAIEEPELYLHPHGCRHFRALLEDLASSGIQVIYTTHERAFIDIARFHDIHLVRKETTETVVFSGAGKPIPTGDVYKVMSKFDDKVNEVFFADKVVLVEGAPDRIACQLALEKLGIEANKASISITECGGDGDMKAIALTLKIFGIPTFPLIDEDPGNTATQAIIKELESITGSGRVFLQKPNLEGMFGLTHKPSKVDAMRLFPQWFSVNKVPTVYEELQKTLI